jgi:hypoxanthine phosphoribosyltransferase
MSELFVTWEQYHQNIEILASKIHASEWEFNQIVCIARGGLRIGDILSRLYHQPLAILFAASYDDEHQQNELQFSQYLAMIGENLGNKVLIVDDLVDSGISLQKAVEWLKSRYPIDEVRTGVLWYKAQSSFKPDYYTAYLPDNTWIYQPFEYYENMTPADLVNRYES